ncbi:suppressor of plc1 deletion [Saccharomyces pastorianus]|uniref:Suppressor of plc1 deletion n=1 Tax=Saccharomyces pastorianus TaxID=27292 RepID=A0A6C1EHE9_SACPS|nr:suppressor of plc1 deletion [Saccharomyces pastorianus]
MATVVPQQEQQQQQQQQQQHRGRRLSEEIASLLRLKESRRLNPAPYYTPRKASQSQSLSESTFKQYNEYVNEKAMSQHNRSALEGDIFDDSSDEEQY